MSATFAVPRSTLLSAPRYDALSSLAEVQEALVRADLIVAPAVVTRLAAVCQGDAAIVIELAQRLHRSQRWGLRALPDPLPLVPAISQRFADVHLDEESHRILLAAAVCVDDRLDVLLELSGLTAEQLLQSPVSTMLTFVAARFAFSDPLARIWIHENAAIAERTRVHAALAQVYARAGERTRHLWHHCLSTLAGDAGVTDALLSQSRRALRRGDADIAYAMAREAASHADAQRLPLARAIAGRAAVGGGWLDDAMDWLEPALTDGTMAVRELALPAYVIASTMRRGAVPSAEIERFRRDITEELQWGVWGRATGLAAALSAERGLRSESRQWLAKVREADARSRAGGVLRTSAEAWTALFTGEEVDVPGDAPTVSVICRGLRTGLHNRPHEGLAALARDLENSEEGEDGLFCGFSRTPVVRAYRALARVLLHTWSGDLTQARQTLDAAATDLPLALPFAGLAVPLARRLEIMMDGRCGALSESMSATVAAGGVLARLMERGMEAYLRGDVDDAAAHVQLWTERSASRQSLGIPTLDEVGPLHPPRDVEPPEARHAHELRRRVRSVRENIGFTEYETIVDEARSIRSPLERGRIEALLGAMCVSRGDTVTGRKHLRAGEALLGAAGATAWQEAVQARLARLGEHLAEAAREPTVPIAVVTAADPLAHCRAAWEPVLTSRELSVAMLVAEGCTNRQIAEKLLVSVRTVEVHIGRLFTKLGVRSRGELTALAHRTNQHI
ncbi:LuxR C-terminal-related transcriptional regulator [Microbacterium sp. YY-01]|uniref:response regulator transcription factor n=1 Tax=Microbacterium sp. YY-01 TaxID=3421634 RepID=UPI003D16C47A